MAQNGIEISVGSLCISCVLSFSWGQTKVGTDKSTQNIMVPKKN